MIPAPDKDYIISLRRELHRCPEVAFDLPRTLAIVRRELEALGIPYTERYGKSSIVGYLNPDGAGKTVALRADLDALPIAEQTGLPFASQIPGQMHACGHDCHTAMLLGTAKALKEIEPSLPCKVRLIFQAAEEAAPGGAKLMCEDGVTDGVDEIVGCHVDATTPTGQVRVSSGKITAISHGFRLWIRGKTAHASRPHLGVDAIALAAQVLDRIQIIRAREVDPLVPVVLGVGEIHGGNANNVVCDEVMLHGTIRTFEEKWDQFLFRRLEDAAAGVCAGTEATYTLETTKRYPCVENDPAVTEAVRRAAETEVGAERLLPRPPALSAEDFSFYTQRIPGMMFHLGVWKEGTPLHPLHNAAFSPDEDALTVAPRIMIRYVCEAEPRS